MKSKTKVILVGEEHSDTSHMQPIAELVIKHLQNNKSVTIALEQNCGSRTMEDLFYTSIPPSRARYKVIENYKKENSTQLTEKELLEIDLLGERNLSLDLQGKYKELFMPIDITIQQNVDKFCVDMHFDNKKNHLDYAISLHKMAIYAFNEKKSLKFISVDTEDGKPKKSIERDIAMYKNIISFDADIVIYPLGSAHIHNSDDGDQRLAALLTQETDVELELANLYTKNNELAYITVQEDIENFKKLFKTKEIVVHDSKQKVLGELLLSEEIKVKNEIDLKKLDKNQYLKCLKNLKVPIIQTVLG